MSPHNKYLLDVLICGVHLQQLETELRKNQTLIQDGMAGFDEMLNTVFMKKIKVMMVIYQVHDHSRRDYWGLQCLSHVGWLMHSNISGISVL